VRTVEDLVADAPALRALSPAHRATIAGCASNRVFAPGERILRAGEPADAFFLVGSGRVAIETDVPGRGPVTLETLESGELLGWSWLVPPHRTSFDARSLGTSRLLALDGACLRAKCDGDPALGYDLLKLLAAAYVERLTETRLRLLDLYGVSGG
jgi:CRP/FNR family transcriptional regulator, cyclic AMP receptor protein